MSELQKSESSPAAPSWSLARRWLHLARWLGPWTASDSVPSGARVEEITIDGVRARLFAPLHRPAAGAYLFSPGLNLHGPDDPRVDRLSRILASAGSLVLARANDRIPVKLVAIVYGKPPQAIFCREDAGLKQAKDLEGSSIANPAGGSIPDLFPAFAKAAGIDAQKVRWVVASSETLPGLLAAGKVPCIGQFTVGEPMLRARL